MKKKKQVAGFTLLSILILACQASGLIATPTSLPPTATVIASTATKTFTPTPTSSPTPTAFQAVQGSPVTFAAGGFIISPIRGYDTEYSSYQAFLRSKDENVTIFLQADPRPKGKFPISVVKTYMEYFKEGIHDFSAEESQDIIIDSAEGVSQDYDGTVKEELVHGRVAVVFPDDAKILTVVVQTTGEGRWESEGELAYSALIKNLSFFKPKGMAKCPVSKNRGYGYSVDSPIQIGGNEAYGPDREQEYLSALLGPHDEIVSFYISDSIKKDGVIIDEYVVSYKDASKIIYMDIYHYNNPNIPFGFTCSTTAPLIP